MTTLTSGIGIVMVALSGYSELSFSASQHEETWRHPAIQGYGKVRSYPDAAARPTGRGIPRRRGRGFGSCNRMPPAESSKATASRLSGRARTPNES
jgi:hypothetical protein